MMSLLRLPLARKFNETIYLTLQTLHREFRHKALLIPHLFPG